MPRKPVPCRSCGKLCNVGGDMSPDGPTCMNCIRARPGYKGGWKPAEHRMITCEICGTLSPSTANRTEGPKRQKTCGADACRKEIERRKTERYWERLGGRGFTPGRNSWRVWHVNCAECAKLFIARNSNQVLCSDGCRRRQLIKQVLDRHYGFVQNAMREGPLLEYLIKRDHGRCGICRKPVRAKSGPMRPSIDHIIPRSLGGGDELENLQLAHMYCNQSKGNRGGGQVLLVG